MAEGEQDDSQKTEDPTPKRLEEARKKGQVAMSRELNNWVMLLAGTMVVATMSSSFMLKLADYLKIFLEQPHLMPQVPGGFSIILGQTFWHVMGMLAIPLIALMLAAFLGPFMQIGPLFAPEVIHPELSKLSPMFKICVVGIAGYMALRPYYDSVDHFVGLPLPDMMREMLTLFVRLMIGVLVVLAVLAAIDVLYQRNDHYKKMRMTRQELRDEYKQSEGDPHIKAKLRQLRSEKARQRMMQAVPTATVVITNPTHFAVALKYDPDKMEAPQCVAKGMDDVALKIREVAKANNVTLYENRPLARILYDTVEIDDMVPPEHYKAVAEIISFVFKLKGKLNS